MESRTGKFGGVIAMVLLTGLAFALTRSGLLPIATTVRQDEGPAGPSDPAPDRGPAPIACRVSLAGEAEQRARLEKQPWFLKHPERLTPDVLRNPLVADALKIEIENISDGDLVLYPSGAEAVPFRFDVRVEDEAGRRVTFPHAEQTGLKRLGPIIGANNSAVHLVARIGPGQVVTHADRIWSHLNEQDMPAPGLYRVRVIVSCFRAPDGRGSEVEADPLFVSVTAREVREWRTLFSPSNRPLPDDEAEEPASPGGWR